jgi:hypothetical protein
MFMFSTVATVKHVQKDVENNRFYAQAEVKLDQDVDQAELQLEDVDDSIHATALMNAKAGVHFFHIEGDGEPSFKVGDTIRVNCFGRGEMSLAAILPPKAQPRPEPGRIPKKRRQQTRNLPLNPPTDLVQMPPNRTKRKT